MKRAAKDKRAGWLVRDVRETRLGYYYTTNALVRNRPVTVHLTTKGTHVCQSCHTADTCEHSKFISDYITANGLPGESK